ncbi:beta-glucosidase BglX [Prevotella sp. E13-17]|uniref:beta-glucosidase BglX n=1 Tax=Prevotella sp. E13-17 TaxID=2913616 RepID=UPI001ED9E04F|nr:beta-glucosidase BglX [Prevotella sp. E13-17]UKK51408.1 beta-glucosidase BglX [Prevotella sp. E13-17]
MRITLLTIMLSAMCLNMQAQTGDMNVFVSQLMSRMTLEEKLGQLNLAPASDEIVTGGAVNTEVGQRIANGQLGGVFNLKGVSKIKALQDIAVKKSRLGIPLIVGMDVIHGYETIFPIPLALACSWDLEAIEEMARISAREASADGINWVYSPMVDICVDARWGRMAEGAGEDPFLGAEVAKVYVRGYQGDSYTPDRVMACVKHYALYGAAEAGRDYNTVDMSRLRMYNQYFPPYKAAAEAGAGSYMSSFNIVDGQHATANRWLLTDVLRNQWKFDGFVVTDYGSIGEMTTWGFGNLKSNSAKALKAGTDMDMCSNGFINTLAASLQDGAVTMDEIDQACRRVLEAKWKLGLFDNPYRHLDAKRRAKDIFTKEHRAAARKMAAETFVLLKNQDELLPLTMDKTIALIGPLANDRANIAGTWCVAYTPERYATVKESLEQRLPKGRLLYAQGCNLTRDEALQKAAEFGKTIPRVDAVRAKAEALAVAQKADVIVCAMGECADFSGESSSRATLEMPDEQRELLAELVKLGKPVVLLHFSGRPTVLTWEQEHVDAIMNVWFAGSEAGDAIADVLFGKVAPSGRLTVTMPQSIGQVPLYYNHLNTGRPVPEGANDYRKYQSNYLELRNDPLYPFGYGLTYTSFSYSDLSLSSAEMAFDGSIEACVTVTNTGKRDGDEIVQLYIHQQAASVARPVKELKGFQRIQLKAGEKRKVTFRIGREQLQYYDAEGNSVLEPGVFDVMIGSDSRRVMSATLRVD